MVARGEACKGKGQKVKGNERDRFPVKKSVSHRDVRHTTGNVVSNVLVTFHGVRWLLSLHWIYKS